mmetsp:Transcript_20597/g.38892  ORF Transcript_20597/g.38892 Transcript_20597/m.38892 type:complete len:118 (-) Transcript_20597:306-659(-)
MFDLNEPMDGNESLDLRELTEAWDDRDLSREDLCNESRWVNSLPSVRRLIPETMLTNSLSIIIVVLRLSSLSFRHSGQNSMWIFHLPSIFLEASLTCGWTKHRPCLSKGALRLTGMT